MIELKQSIRRDLNKEIISIAIEYELHVPRILNMIDFCYICVCVVITIWAVFPCLILWYLLKSTNIKWAHIFNLLYQVWYQLIENVKWIRCLYYLKSKYNETYKCFIAVTKWTLTWGSNSSEKRQQSLSCVFSNLFPLLFATVF